MVPERRYDRASIVCPRSRMIGEYWRERRGGVTMGSSVWDLMARAELPEVEAGGKDGMFQISWLRIGVCGSSDWLRVWNNAFVSQKNWRGTSRMARRTFCAKRSWFREGHFPHPFSFRQNYDRGAKPVPYQQSSPVSCLWDCLSIL